MITKLDWDTNFFGINIAKMDFNNEELFNSEIKQLKDEGTKIVYCFCKNKNDYINKIGELVDEKVTYHKILNNDHISLNDVIIEEYMNEEPTDELYKLAIQSGIYSRFNVDTGFSNDKFVDLYKTWIKNSVNKQMAYKVLVSKSNGLINGMVTLGEKDGRGDIGLIAVDANSRGKGIAKALMSVTEQDFKTRFKEAQVVTQKDNIPACSLYEKFSYKVEKVEQIYHIWL